MNFSMIQIVNAFLIVNNDVSKIGVVYGKYTTGICQQIVNKINRKTKGEKMHRTY